MAKMSQLVNISALRRFRRIILFLTSRFAYRRFIFALLATAILAAKTVHVYAHLAALSTVDIVRWGCSFYAQDTAVLLVARQLVHDGPFMPTWFRTIGTTLVSAVAAFALLLATTGISFWAVAGSELHWRNIGLASDSSSWSLLLSGLAAFLVVLFGILFAGWVLQDPCYALAGIALDIIVCPLRFLLRYAAKDNRLMQRLVGYERIPRSDFEDASRERADGEEADDEKTDSDSSDKCSKSSWTTPTAAKSLYVFVGAVLLAQLICLIGRPAETSLVFMSWTLPLIPLVDFMNSSPSVAGVLHLKGNDTSQGWVNRTALADPVPLDWLPKDASIAGFEDWYENKEHYRAAKDPLKISNLHQDLLPALRGELAKVKIKHVMMIQLESTRKDVFPFKKKDNNIFWDRLVDSWGNKTMPNEIRQKLANLTPTASFLTGDYDTGFEHVHQKRRGGMNIRNAYTTSTYTLKSLTGMLCGLTPLVVDFNLEHKNHVYQPCLPHIFDVFNKLEHPQKTEDFTSFNWKSSFMQSATGTYDKQKLLMPVLGFEDFIYRQYLESDSAKFGKVRADKATYNGIPETTLVDYITDAFRSAKKNNERVFLSHLTSTTHHPFFVPPDVESVSFADAKTKGQHRISRYLNTIGYADRWLAKILEILEKEGVADETLLVLVGDHGTSIPEDGGVTPYYSPHEKNFHVPLVFSHPQLPHLDVDGAAISSQILPTILDLFLETKSLSKSQAVAARDLMQNYEGQSLLRPLQQSSEETGQGNWHFTVMNPGGGMLAIRDGRQPNLRLIVPIVDDLEWRFTDLGSDPREEAPILSFSFNSFLDKVEEKHDLKARKWAEEAASVSQWWLGENTKRWRYKSSSS